MKFLCLRCNTAMKLDRVEESGKGSLAVFFRCSDCEKGVAMLTNPFETQMVKSLDVKVGGASSGGTERMPMEFMRTNLLKKREGMETSGTEPEETGQKKGCPFAGMLREVRLSADAVTAKTAEADEKPLEDPRLTWTAEARARLDRIPEFVRPMAKAGIEQYARQFGHEFVTARLMDEVKEFFGG